MNDKAVRRMFDLFDDSHYEIFTKALDSEMIKSKSLGLVGGNKKKLRDPISPKDLRKVFDLDWKKNPVYLEYVIVVNVMLLLAIRGGRELAEGLNWAQFSMVKDRSGTPIYWEYDPNEHGEKQRQGGVRTFRMIRDKVRIEYLPRNEDSFNPGLLFERYAAAQQPGYIDRVKRNRFFTKPLSK